MNLIRLVPVLLVLFVLGACGGGGSSGPAPMTTDPDPMPTEPTPSVDLMGLAVPADDYMIAAGETMDVGEGESEVTLSCSAAADCSFTVAEDGMATATSGEVTAALSEAAMEAANAAKQAMIMGLTVAIADPNEDGSPTGGQMKSERPGGTTTMITVAAGGEITYGDDDILGKDDEDVEDQFGTPMDAAQLTKWVGTKQSRTVENVMTELVVYSNAEDPKDRSYMAYFAAVNANVATNPNTRPAIVSAITDFAGTDNSRLGKYDGDNEGEGTLTLGGTFDASAHSKLFGGSLFQSPTGATNQKSIPGAMFDPPGDAVAKDGQNEVTGTFSGIPGTFVCGADDSQCTVSFNAKGELTAISNDWTFVPAAAGARGKVMDVVVDRDYLAFGYWLETTTEVDGSMTYGVNTFATGSMPYDVTNMGGLTKTATYNGKATGLYVEKDFSTGAGVPSAAGQFTADTRLTASFGGLTVPQADQFTIRGTVNNFRNTDGMAISGGAWNVNLMKADFSGRTTANTAPGSTYESTFNGMTTGGGTWNGMFYGDGVTDTDTEASGVQSAPPTGVSGEFNAHLGNGHVIGAFGATR